MVALVQGGVTCVWTDDITSDADVGAATVIMNTGSSAEAADEAALSNHLESSLPVSFSGATTAAEEKLLKFYGWSQR